METIKANNAKDVKIPANEAHLYHVKLVKKEANNVTKEFEDRGITQVYTAIDFAQMDKSGFFKQYDEVIILHNPNKKGTDAELDDEGNPVDRAPKETPAQKKAREEAEKARIKSETELSKANAKKAKQLEDNGGAAPVIPVVKDGQGGTANPDEGGEQKDEATLAIELNAARDEYKTLHGGEEADEKLTIDQLNAAIEAKKGF